MDIVQINALLRHNLPRGVNVLCVMEAGGGMCDLRPIWYGCPMGVSLAGTVGCAW